jgi:hypothetical protein
MQAEAASVLGAERSSVVTALRNAAAATGSDFHYLLGTAMRESSLRPDAQSSSSSAAGLFQFIDQTWLGLVKEHGARYGLGNYAAAITKEADGHYHAAAGERQEILALRKDPDVCAIMAGEYAKTTQGEMRANLGRDVCGGELYAAHFLGPDAACRLIRLVGSDPSANAAAQFPQAASANRSVFFHADGSAKSVHEVYDWAMRQPGGEGTIRVAQLPAIAPSHESARLRVDAAGHAEMQMLMQSVMNWQPGGGQSQFGNLFGMNNKLAGNLGLSGMGLGGTPSSALSFSPNLLGILSDAKSQSS